MSVLMLKKNIFFLILNFLPVQIIFSASRPPLLTRTGQAFKTVGSKIALPFKKAGRSFNQSYNALKGERKDKFEAQLLSTKPISYGLINKKQLNDVKEKINNENLILERYGGYKYAEKDSAINQSLSKEGGSKEKQDHDLNLGLYHYRINKLNNYKPNKVFDKSAYYARNAGDVFKVFGRGLRNKVHAIKDRITRKNTASEIVSKIEPSSLRGSEVVSSARNSQVQSGIGERAFITKEKIVGNDQEKSVEVKSSDEVQNKFIQETKKNLTSIQQELKKLEEQKSLLEKKIEEYQNKPVEVQKQIKEQADREQEGALRDFANVSDASNKQKVLETDFNDPDKYAINLEKINEKINKKKKQEEGMVKDLKVFELLIK